MPQIDPVERPTFELDGTVYTLKFSAAAQMRLQRERVLAGDRDKNGLVLSPKYGTTETVLRLFIAAVSDQRQFTVEELGEMLDATQVHELDDLLADALRKAKPPSEVKLRETAGNL